MANPLTILIAQYRLPFPLYYSGADKFNLELALFLSKKGHHVRLMYSMGYLSKDIVERKMKQECLRKNFHLI